MNFLQRLAARLRAALAAARGFETGVITPLPQARVPPRTTARELIDEADRTGVADAKSYMNDSWSFGGPGDPESDRFDPPYIHVLRHRCQTALATTGEYRDLTASRLSHVREWRDEHARMMESARSMMTRQAMREAWSEEEITRPPVAAAGTEQVESDRANANASGDEREWEGESVVLGWFWRALILFGLVGAEYAVQYPVYAIYFAGTPWSSSTELMTLATAALVVVAPYVAGLLVRGRQGTGAVRRIGLGVAVLSLPWGYVTVVLGVLRSQTLTSDEAGGVPGRLHLTPLTVTVMFVALLLITGVMSFMLGLARRHPFQDSYVRQRTQRNRLDVLRRTMADRINPEYLEPDDTTGSGQSERAIRESYAAAEYAYFAALVRTVGDPAFTEAVQARRGLRPPAPPLEQQVTTVPAGTQAT